MNLGHLIFGSQWHDLAKKAGIVINHSHMGHDALSLFYAECKSMSLLVTYTETSNEHR